MIRGTSRECYASLAWLRGVFPKRTLHPADLIRHLSYDLMASIEKGDLAIMTVIVTRPPPADLIESGNVHSEMLEVFQNSDGCEIVKIERLSSESTRLIIANSLQVSVEMIDPTLVEMIDTKASGCPLHIHLLITWAKKYVPLLSRLGRA